MRKRDAVGSSPPKKGFAGFAGHETAAHFFTVSVFPAGTGVYSIGKARGRAVSELA